MKRIIAYPAKCMACRACEIGCALAHVDTEDLVQALYERGAQPRIYIEEAEGFAVPLQCRHCDDAPCVAVCPSGALSRPNPAEPVLVDQGKCIGCGYCVEACPFGVILLARQSLPGASGGRSAVVKCDLCIERQAEGLDPACVASCPVAALTFEEDGDQSRKARARAAAKAVAYNTDGNK